MPTLFKGFNAIKFPRALLIVGNKQSCFLFVFDMKKMWIKSAIELMALVFF